MLARTPSSWFSFLSTRAAQEAQVMPLMVSSSWWLRPLDPVTVPRRDHRLWPPVISPAR
jgi:hypothetical protein